jgi:hypothetical protein
MNRLLRWSIVPCLAAGLLAGCTGGDTISDSAKKADAADPALRTSMPPDGTITPRVPGVGGGANAGPGQGTAEMPKDQGKSSGGNRPPAIP